MQQRPPLQNMPSSPLSLPIFQQETQQLPTIPSDTSALTEMPSPLIPHTLTPKQRLTRVIATVIALLLVGAIYFIWFSVPSASPSTAPGVTQQSFGTSSQSTGTATGGNLHVYVVGAVKKPGLYILPPGARVYQLLQVAGGVLPQANLVMLNLAAPLTDGQEVYVLAIGETPPTYQGIVPGPSGNSTVTTSGTVTPGQLVNINTASVEEMRLALHVSSTTAQDIINFRTQHGPYTSIDQLLQVVSRSIYDKIKNSVTV